jgi:uncharacterized protein (DUF302 family)
VKKKISFNEIATAIPYDVLTKDFEDELGKYDAGAVALMIQEDVSWKSFEKEMVKMAGNNGLMLFFKADQGRVASINSGEIRCALYLVGNPFIAAQIVNIDIRASFLVPFRVSIYEKEKGKGAFIGFQRPSSFLGELENDALMSFGQLLDSKISSIINRITSHI